VIPRKHQNKLTRAWGNAWRRISVESPVSFDEWSRENFRLAAVSSSVPGPWIPFSWQVGIGVFMSVDEVTMFTFVKSSQVGGTKQVAAFLLYGSMHKKRSEILYQPSNAKKEEFVISEIDSLVPIMPLLRDALPKTNRRNSSGNNAHKKVLNGVHVYFRGGYSESAYRGTTADTVILDDLDGFNRSIGGDAGNPVTLAGDRTKSSLTPKVILVSTPKGSNSMIMHRHDLSDLKLKRLIPCLECGHYYALQRTTLDVDKNTLMAKPHHICPECGDKSEFKTLKLRDSLGEWRDEEAGIWLDEKAEMLRDNVGAPVPWPPKVGASINVFYSLFVSWQKSVNAFNDGETLWNEERNDSLQRTFANTGLAEVFLEHGQSNSPEEIRRHGIAPDQRLRVVPDDVVMLSMGVDIGKKRLHCTCIGVTRDLRLHVVDYRIINATDATLHTDQAWDDLAALISDGVGGKLFASIFIDSRYGTSAVKTFCLSMQKGLVIPIEGRPHSKGVRFREDSVSFEGRVRSDVIKVASVGLDEFKPMAQAGLQLRKDARFSISLPEDVDDDYIHSMTSEKRIEENGKYRWVTIHLNNHYWDSLVYALAAMSHLGAFTIRTKRETKKIVVDEETGEIIQEPRQYSVAKSISANSLKKKRRKQSKAFMH
jgi:phage terminase large subunit GpA-like protein